MAADTVAIPRVGKCDCRGQLKNIIALSRRSALECWTQTNAEQLIGRTFQ